MTTAYNNGTTTVAEWYVPPLETVRRAKNVILFIGDGMTQNMITAARLIAHKSVNGRYQTLMQMDQMPVLGHQMTHSIDSFITDSANSATALYSGHKTTVNALGCYKDSSADPFDDPKIESIAELFHRRTGGSVGIVSTAFIADATPGGLTAHTPQRSQYGAVVDSFLHGITNYTWTVSICLSLQLQTTANSFSRTGLALMSSLVVVPSNSTSTTVPALLLRTRIKRRITTKNSPTQATPSSIIKPNSSPPQMTPKPSVSSPSATWTSGLTGSTSHTHSSTLPPTNILSSASTRPTSSAPRTPPTAKASPLPTSPASKK